MKRAIFAHLDAGGAGLATNVHEALTSLKQP
jgi:formate dehydrogenase subunit delta